jgi:hypothetical protein
MLFVWLRRSTVPFHVIAKDLERHVGNAAFFSSGNLPEFRGRKNADSFTVGIASHVLHVKASGCIFARTKSNESLALVTDPGIHWL